MYYVIRGNLWCSIRISGTQSHTASGACNFYHNLPAQGSDSTEIGGYEAQPLVKGDDEA